MAMLLFTGAEARTPHFRVVTQGPAETAAAAATVLERTRSQFKVLGFHVPPGPTEVVLFRDLEEIRPYAPDQATGFFQQGTDASFIAVAWEREGLRELAHELAHQAMAWRIGRQPPWLREGLAELLSNLEPVPGGLKIGAPIAMHLRGPHPDFYARSWLLAHRLVVGSGGPLPARPEALETPTELPEQVPQKLPTEVLPLASPLAEPPAPVVRSLDAWEYEHRLAELWRARNLTAQARGALVSLRVRFPGRPEPAESLGAIDMDAFHYDQAE
ncbi:MAG: hypothetical protein HY238_02805 [Acidobacteria bacterium]|nr:hypothetical protein [Acidobacteriota bacterium]